jgi:hypothetical protein
MRAIRSLSGEDQTWRRLPNSVENDPWMSWIHIVGGFLLFALHIFLGRR